MRTNKCCTCPTVDAQLTNGRTRGRLWFVPLHADPFDSCTTVCLIRSVSRSVRDCSRRCPCHSCRLRRRWARRQIAHLRRPIRLALNLLADRTAQRVCRHCESIEMTMASRCSCTLGSGPDRSGTADNAQRAPYSQDVRCCRTIDVEEWKKKEKVKVCFVSEQYIN